MFETLTATYEVIARRLRGRGTLSARDIEQALEDLRAAFLDADVHLDVVTTLLEAVRRKALARPVLESLTPGEQVLTIVWEEVTAILGGDRPTPEPGLASMPPTVYLMVGLQGSGKTTTGAKLAKRFTQQGRRVLVVASDTRRPAAAEQLAVLAAQAGAEVYRSPEPDPVAVALAAIARAKAVGHDVVIVDSQGRLQVDEALMDELVALHQATAPHEVLFVADAMMGQEAVRIARAFHDRIRLTGVILTKADGDMRAGAILSIRTATGLPIRYLGVGETLEALERFHPGRLASRLLGRGDLQTLVEKAEEVASATSALPRADATVPRPDRQNQINLVDFRDQLRQFTRMGSVREVLGFLPGGGRLADRVPAQIKTAEGDLTRWAAIIDSMTPGERTNPKVLDGSRRRRIAAGSGTTPMDVNRLLKTFLETKKMMKGVQPWAPRAGAARAGGAVRWP